MGTMKITEIKGIGQSYEKKLRKAGIKTIYDLREMNIKKTSKLSGIGEQLLKKWKDESMKMLLLTDVKGIGNEFRKKLEKHGITTIEKLAGADKKTASKIGIPESRFTRWIKEAKKMTAKKEVKTAAKRAVVAEEIGPGNASITVKGKRAVVKIKEKVHENVPVFRGNIGDVVKDKAIAVNIGNSGKIKLWFDGRWYEDVPAREETLWGRMKKIWRKD